MVEPLRHRQTKGAATDMFYLMPPRHISTLHIASFRCDAEFGRHPGIADIAGLAGGQTPTRMMWWTTPAPGIECAKG
jgi:hypothetical protein